MIGTAGVAQLGEQQTEAHMAFWRSRVQSTVLAFLLPENVQFQYFVIVRFEREMRINDESVEGHVGT
jgi:hypothetical protein